jgi:tetratricopeptide (TPR) repeat protein
MELKLIPHDKNQFPFKGLLIQGTSVMVWMQEIQALEQPLGSLQIYPVPGITPNSIWGCLVVSAQDIPREKTGKHQGCQAVTPTVFIPERSTLSPMPSAAELEKLFASGRYMIHPEFGWVELPEALALHELMDAPVVRPMAVVKPAASVHLPATIRSFQVKAPTIEEVMAHLEQSFPEHREMEKKPLNLWEKTRLGFYRLLMSDSGPGGAGAASKGEMGEGIMTKILDALGKLFSGKSLDRMMHDFNDLEERNKRQIDRLVDMLRENPEEALHYAIPLDENNTTRGNPNSAMQLSRWHGDLSLFGKRTPGTGGSFNSGDHFYVLQRQYQATAEELIRKKDFHKAAFVYLNLLKDYRKAAQTLEAGKYYQEAATVYLKHVKDKLAAAACFENGSMTHEAIALYKELNQHEKVGDLYTAVADERQATEHYTKAVDVMKNIGQYIKAASLSRDKMKNKLFTQTLLLEGWRNQQDPVNCLNMYLSLINVPGDREKEIRALSRSETAEQKPTQFLEVVKHEYKKDDAEHDPLKELAYEIIATQMVGDPSIVSELKAFNPWNKELSKDTLRFKTNKQ